ncbi:unnamed protein product [Knipowitschia caucasica]|uniref:Vesicle transport protein n=1 Tax=Knipowitschia caucasica TaxID=637954 RepID=A0AAV2JXK6_KNICA
MADLKRQLDAYLAQSKAKSGSPPLLSPEEELLSPGEEQGERAGWTRWSRWSHWSSAAPEQTPEPCLPSLTRTQRLSGFALFASLSALCFVLSAMYAPLLLLYARKFCLLWSLGSVFAVAALVTLRGAAVLRSLLMTPVAAVYLCALGGTLYAALSMRSTVLTALGASTQVVLLLGAAVSLVPGGAAGLRFMSGLVTSAVRRGVSGKSVLPV